MKNNATKEQLMEMLVKLNPELIMEVAPAPAPTAVPTPTAAPAATAPAVPKTPAVSSAAQIYGKKLGAATALGAAGQGIDSMTKFKQTFSLWLPTLPIKPKDAPETPENKGKTAVTKSQVIFYVGQALSEMGYK